MCGDRTRYNRQKTAMDLPENSAILLWIDEDESAPGFLIFVFAYPFVESSFWDSVAFYDFIFHHFS